MTKIRSKKLSVGRDYPRAWLPTDLPNVIWAFDANNVKINNSAPINFWEDQSGNGYHLTSSYDPIYWPQWYESDSDINNMPYLKFNNNDKFDYITIPNKAQPITFAIVFYNKLDHQSEYILYGSGANTFTFQPKPNPSDLYWSIWAGDPRLFSNVRLPTAWDYWVCLYNGASSYMRKGGIEVASGATGTDSMGNFTIGLSLYGGVAYAIAIQKILTSVELNKLESFFAHRYGL